MMVTETEQKNTNAENSFSIRGHIFTASFIIAVLIFGVGAWAATAKLMGAVIAPGKVVVDKNSKKIQHPDGGIISKINVKNGDRVEAGQVLLSIDETQLKANIQIFTIEFMAPNKNNFII